MSAETIARALGAAYRSGGRWRCRCPVHGGTGATLALRDVGGKLQAQCFKGCSQADIIAELKRQGLTDKAAAKPDPAEVERQREADTRDRAKRITTARWL